MTYILIVMWFGTASFSSGRAALAVEFNDLKSCQAAAAEIRKQGGKDAPIGAMLCAEKGRTQ